MYIENIKLKQARINTGISVKDMSYLLNIDSSNLSKYEKGILKASRELLYGYHCITGQDFGELQRPFFSDYIDDVSVRIAHLISQLERKKQSQKTMFQIENLYEILDNLTHLKEKYEV